MNILTENENSVLNLIFNFKKIFFKLKKRKRKEQQNYQHKNLIYKKMKIFKQQLDGFLEERNVKCM